MQQADRGDLQVDDETKRALLNILQTMKDQEAHYHVPGLAKRIDEITQEVHRPESSAIGPHLLSILDVLREQLVPELAGRIERIKRELDKPESFTIEHYLSSILEIMREQQRHRRTPGIAERIDHIAHQIPKLEL